jgi:hypothetical protein
MGSSWSRTTAARTRPGNTAARAPTGYSPDPTDQCWVRWRFQSHWL